MPRISTFLILILAVFTLSFSSCRSSGGADAAMKRINDTKDAKAAEVQKQYDKALKHHKSIQTKSTRKQMKDLKKKSKEFNKNTKGK